MEYLCLPTYYLVKKVYEKVYCYENLSVVAALGNKRAHWGLTSVLIREGVDGSTVEPPNKGHFGTSHFVLC